MNRKVNETLNQQKKKVLLTGRIFKVFVFRFDFLDVLRVDDPYRPRQVAESAGIVQVQLFRRVIGKDPRENWVLRQIIQRSSGNRVQLRTGQ